METFFIIMFWILIFDSIGANIVSWFGLTKWYHNFTVISRLFPATRGWTTYYLVLVLFIGFILQYFDMDIWF